MSSTISYQSGSHSKSQVVKLTHTWTIDNYSLRFDENSTSISISSSQFLAPDFGFGPFGSSSGHKFQLNLCPNEKTNKSHFSVSLSEVSYQTFFPIFVKCKFAIVSTKGEKYFPNEVQGKFHSSECFPCANFTKLSSEDFFSQSALLSKAELLLPDDKLTIVAEISYLTNTKSILIGFSNAYDDYANLLSSEKLSDVVLNVSGTEFCAHKAILAARSPVFCAMFEHRFTEKQNSRVRIIDVKPEAFQLLLSYIYTGKIDSIEKNTEELLAAADKVRFGCLANMLRYHFVRNKYQLIALKSHCEQYLCSKVSVETAPNLLLLADSYNAHNFFFECSGFNETPITRNHQSNDRCKYQIAGRHVSLFGHQECEIE